ncbi:MAG: response regulator transcription factor [Bacteroidales bacterium]|nr:response regulator transcription factor [Bacteroidales bacterium]
MNKKIKVLFVEDEQSLGLIVKESLEIRGFEVIYCQNGLTGIQAFKTSKPDICVLDVMMPVKDGYTLAGEIRRIDSQIPIIFLTAKSQTRDVVKGFEVGGNDYIKKPFSIEELIVRIQARLTDPGHSLHDNDKTWQFTIGRYKFDSKKQVLEYRGQLIRLTHRESEILRLLCINRNQVLERSLVLNKVWGDDNFFNARSMDVFITKLRKHLQMDPSIEIINVRGIGYKLVS